MGRFNQFLVDTELLLHTGLLGASSVGQDAASDDQILDLGGDGAVRGDVVIDLVAVEVASGTEVYSVGVEFSSSPTFASGKHAGPFIGFGNNAAGSLLVNASADRTTGRFILPVTNEFNGTAYRYMRLYIVVAGDIATGIDFDAYFTPTR